MNMNMNMNIKKLATSLILITILTLSTFAGYKEQMALARDATFVNRVKMGMVNTAIAISNESTGTSNHAARTALSKACLNSPDQYAQLLAVGVASDTVTFPATVDGQGNATNGATVATDAAIDTRLSAIWDSYAGKP